MKKLKLNFQSVARLRKSMLAMFMMAGVAYGVQAAPVPSTPPYLATVDTTGSYYGAASGTVVAPNLTLTSDPSITFNTAKVTIGAGFIQSDILEFTDMNGISGSYDASTGILTLTGSGSAADYQAALRTVRFYNTTTLISSTTTRNINFIIGAALYNEYNGHFYELVDNGNSIDWTVAKNNAAAKSLYGLQGYLVTVTSGTENDFVSEKINSNTWMGASDAASEGIWRWVSGPEGLEAGGLGRHFSDQFKTGFCSANQAQGINGYFAAWANGEPNDCGAGEDVAHFIGSTGTWNDFPYSGGVSYYLVEYGGMPGDPTLQLTDHVTMTVLPTPNYAPVLTDASIAINEDASVALLDEISANNPGTFSDINNDNPHSVRFESLPSHGTIYQDGGYPALANTVYSLVQFSLMYYVPNTDYNGPDSFELGASDGLLWAATPATVSIAVNSVNDAPVLEDIAVVTEEETPVMISAFTTATTYTDLEGDTISAMQIVTLPASGMLTLYAQPVTAGDVVYIYEIENLLYIPNTDFNGSDSFVFNATDGADYAVSSATVAITVTPINDSPTDIVSSVASFDENLAVGTVIGSLSSTDVDAGDSHVYQLISGAGDLGNVYFSLAGNQLMLDNNVNYERTTQLSIRVQTVDQGGLAFEKVILLDVNDVNDTPTDLVLSNNTVDEQQSVGSFVGSFSTADEDAIDSHTLTLVSGAGDTGNSSFAIVNNVLTTAATFDLNTQQQYSIRVRSTDSGLTSTEKVFLINVLDVNQAPTAIALSNATIAENNTIGAFVGYLTATDADANDTHTYALVTGQGDDDNASFTLVNGDLTAAEVFDFEAKSSYSIRVEATDATGATFEQVFAITIVDAADSPIGITISADSINENESIGTLVGSLTTLDPDQVGGHTYGLVGGIGADDNGSFSLAGNVIFANTSFNFEAKSAYSIRVRSTDGAGNYVEEVIAINVNDMNDAPSDVAINIIGIDENSPIGTAVGNITATDEDLADLHTFTLVPGFGGADNGKFTILANKLQVNANLDYEAQSSYAVRVRATDTNGASVEANYTVIVSDVNETPTSLTLSADSINENEPAGAIIGFLSIADQDNGDSHTFDLVSGAGDADNGSFYISGNMLIANASFNYEVKNSYSIRLSGTDLGGLKEEGMFTITINNVSDAPVAANITRTVYKGQNNRLSAREFNAAFSQEEGNSQKHIRIMSLPANGQLLFSNTPVVAGQTILVAEFNSLSYTPASSYLGADAFTFAAYDGVMYSADATYALTVVNARTVGGATSGTIVNGGIISLNPGSVSGPGVAREGGISSSEEMPLDVTVFSNYPNPFQGTTSIKFELSGQMTVTLEVYDLLGRKVASLIDAEALTGEQIVNWNGGEANGQYIAHLSATAADGSVITKTISLVQTK